MPNAHVHNGHQAHSGAQAPLPGIAPLQLAKVNDAAGLRAALLALLVPAGSRRPALAWLAETAGNPQAPTLRDEVVSLAALDRLPWFERLLARVAHQPMIERQRLLEAARRVMQSRGACWPIDTLHWLLMRHRLGDHASLVAAAGTDVAITELREDEVHAIARYSAFLARLVPRATIDQQGHQAWYASVMRVWQGRVPVPPCDPAPDVDTLVHALHRVQQLPRLQRPILMRAWLSAALKHSEGGHLALEAANALRMSSALLDSTMQPELAAYYIHIPPQ